MHLSVSPRRAPVALVILTVALALGLLVGCTGPAMSRIAPLPPIRIGVVVAHTGTNVTATIQAAEMAVSEANLGGGLNVGGRKQPVALVIRPIDNRAEAAAAAVQELINQQNVVAIVGPQVSRNAIPAAEIAERARIPLISPVSTNPRTTAGKRYIFRGAFIDPYQGSVMATFARDELGSERAAILYDIANDYNRGVAEIFRNRYEAAGGEVVAFEEYTTGQRDFSAALARIAAAEPDVLLLPNFSEDVALQAAQARALGLGATLLGTDGWSAILLADDPNLEGAYYSHLWSPQIANEQGQAFVAAYRDAMGEEPPNAAAVTYDVFGMLFQAIQREGEATPEAIRRGLAATGRYTGVSGTMVYPPDSGDPSRSAVISRFVDGAAQVYTVVEP